MSEQIIPEALRWLQVPGINIIEEKIHLRCIILTVTTIILLIFELLQIVFNFNNVDIVAGVMEVCSPVYLSLIKLLMVLQYRKTLSKINKNISQFWKTGIFDKKLKAQLESMFTTVKTMLASYRWLAMTTTTMITVLKPIVDGNGDLPIDIWQPIDLLSFPRYEITYALECSSAYFASFINIAIDSLYVGYVMHVIAQCILLKHAFKNIPLKYVRTYEEETVCWSDMKKYIAYHNQLLNVIDDIQNSHSFTFMNVFAAGTLSVCIDLYSVAVDNGTLDVMRIIKYTFQCSFFVFLLFAYCFTGNQLTNQCLSISDAVYESEWYYSSLPRIRKGVILVIQKSQNEIKLNAGGLMTLNLENFIKMLRLSFSVFTLIRAQAEKEI